MVIVIRKSVCTRPTPKQSCNLPPDSGQCSSWLRRFYYNTATGRCEEFHYKGCKGNANRFKTFRECSDICE
ncbi:protease bitisilin-3-like inhibitor, partial [Mytilus galloprovincialis]